GLRVARRGLGQAAVEAKVVTVLLVGAVELVVDAVAARVDAAADLRLGGGRVVGVDGPRPDTGRALAVALLVDPPGPALDVVVVGKLVAGGSVGAAAEGERCDRGDDEYPGLHGSSSWMTSGAETDARRSRAACRSRGRQPLCQPADRRNRARRWC